MFLLSEGFVLIDLHACFNSRNYELHFLFTVIRCKQTPSSGFATYRLDGSYTDRYVSYRAINSL